MGAVLDGYDRADTEVRRIMRGEKNLIRIGYLASAAKDYLDGAVGRVRGEHPGLVIKYLDLSPGEQITAIRAGEIDLGRTDQSAKLLDREFYTRELVSIPNVVGLPEFHPLAKLRSVRLGQLKKEMFVKADENQVPGINRRISTLCWKYGRFRPRYIGGPTSTLADALQTIANENAVAILPGIARNHAATGVIMLPIADKDVSSSIHLIWQRGKPSKPLRSLLDALFTEAARKKSPW